uniref:Uncharacterized protein n=1 Tax=Timema monikensis TaxID=170555 RepID=A0A7R9E347_9NEOP|nr:unnamed protein product [Timema monikensis]
MSILERNPRPPHLQQDRLTGEHRQVINRHSTLQKFRCAPFASLSSTLGCASVAAGYSSPMASLVLTDSSQLTYDSQHLAVSQHQRSHGATVALETVTTVSSIRICLRTTFFSKGCLSHPCDAGVPDVQVILARGQSQGQLSLLWPPAGRPARQLPRLGFPSLARFTCLSVCLSAILLKQSSDSKLISKLRSFRVLKSTLLGKFVLETLLLPFLSLVSPDSVDRGSRKQGPATLSLTAFFRWNASHVFKRKWLHESASHPRGRIVERALLGADRVFNHLPPEINVRELPNGISFTAVSRVSREESRPSAVATASSSSPPAPSTTNTSRRLLEEVLQRPAPYPMIVLPPGGGYWLDGQDHDCPFDPRGQPILPHNAWRSKIETDDTAKCYRRFFVGRVSFGLPCLVTPHPPFPPTRS